MHCQLCGGPLTPLGTLGRLVWFRCRNCGADQHEESQWESNYGRYGPVRPASQRSENVWADDYRDDDDR